MFDEISVELTKLGDKAKKKWTLIIWSGSIANKLNLVEKDNTKRFVK